MVRGGGRGEEEPIVIHGVKKEGRGGARAQFIPSWSLGAKGNLADVGVEGSGQGPPAGLECCTSAGRPARCSRIRLEKLAIWQNSTWRSLLPVFLVCIKDPRWWALKKMAGYGSSLGDENVSVYGAHGS